MFLSRYLGCLPASSTLNFLVYCIEKVNNRFSDGFLFVCFYQDIWGVFSDTSRDAFPFLWTWKVVFLYMQAEISGTDKASNPA